MKKIFICLFICLILCGCNTVNNKTIINQDYIEKIVMEKEYIILDVRTKEEYNELHVKDAINIPVSEIDENISLDKNKIIFVYCKSGNRSGIAYETLNSLGYNIYDLGGIDNIDMDKE